MSRNESEVTWRCIGGIAAMRIGPAVDLCSDAAEHVTGQMLLIDGGISAWQQPKDKGQRTRRALGRLVEPQGNN